MARRYTQPQTLAPVNPALGITTLISPVLAPPGQFRNVLGPSWTYSGALTSSVSRFGKSLQTTTGYMSRANPYTSGSVTVGIIFVPTSVTGTEGIWSLADVYASINPHLLLQRNGADLRVYLGGAYGLTVTGCFSIGAQANIVLAISNLALDTSTLTLTLGINGTVYSVTAAQDTKVLTNEFFMSGYNGQADGYYGEHWSAPANLASLVGSLSGNPWQIFAPINNNIWLQSAASGVSLAGVSAASGQAAIAPAIDLAITGNSAAATVGTPVASLTVGLTGNTAGATVGTVTPSVVGGTITVALAGNSAVSSVGDLGAPSNGVGAADYGDKPKRPKKRFVVKVGDKLMVFSKAQDALNAVEQTKDTPKPIPDEVVPVKVIKQAVKVDAKVKAQVKALFSQHDYLQALKVYEALRQEQEDEELLLLLA